MLDYLKLIRPKEWIKNLAVLAGPVFAQRFDAESLWAISIIFAAFCLVSGASYVINDLSDRQADALHPVKKNRPLASGAVSPLPAALWAAFLVAGGVVLSAWLLPMACTVVVVAYFLLILSYSLALKRRMILDVILIAIGFVLRATAGAAAVGVVVSPWLFVCTFTLCMFLGFGKRRCEIAIFDNLNEARAHRETLARYTPELLNHLISVSGGIAIMTFLLYTMDRDPTFAPPFHKQHLLYTIPLVVYGVFRYAMVIESGQCHGPVDVILRDRPFLGNIIIWTVCAAGIIWEKQWMTAFGWERFFDHG